MPFIESEREISQGSHDVGLGAFRDAGGVFAHADVAPVVEAVLDCIPVPTDGFKQGGLVVGARICAAHVIGIFLLLFIHTTGAQVVAFAPESYELAATAQPGLFGAEAFALNAPACQPPVFLNPPAVMSAGKKILGAV